MNTEHMLHTLLVVYPGCEDGILWYFDTEDERNKAHDIAGGLARWSEPRECVPESQLPAGDFVTEAWELENCLLEREDRNNG